MKCNLFSKSCDLLTCTTKRKCLWSKLEGDKIKESVRNWDRPVFPPMPVNHIK